MLGALKVWRFGKTSSKVSPRIKPGDVTFTSSNSDELDGDDAANDMSSFGHLLLCPVCDELLTHPVLLPCQHTMCYGCARSQLVDASLSSIIDEEDSMTSSTLVMSPSRKSRGKNLSSTMVGSPKSGRRFSLLNSPSYLKGNSPKLGRSPLPSPTEDSAFLDSEFDNSVVLTTNDLLHFESPGSNPKRTKSPRLSLTGRNKNSPSSGRSSLTSSSSVTSSTTSLRSLTLKNSNLKRSSSTSSIARAASLRHHHQQQTYETLKNSKVRDIFCPVCDSRVELGKLGISGLFRNFALESIVERFRSRAKAAVAIRCGFCKPPASDATKSCLDCKLSFCNECYKTVHVWGTKKASHGYVGPTNTFVRPKVLICPEHNREAINMYCNKCKKSVCRMCKIGAGGHVNHPCSTAKSAYKEGKEKLYADLAVLKDKKEAVNAKIQSLSLAFGDLERKEAATRSEIHTTIDEMHRLLEFKRNDLLGRADTEIRAKEQQLRQEMQRHHTTLMLATVGSFAEEVLKETDPNYFLQTYRMVEIKVKEAIHKIDEVNRTGEKISPVELHLDTNQAVENLQGIDFIQAPKTPEIEAPESSIASLPLITWADKAKNIENYEVMMTSESGESVVKQLSAGKLSFMVDNDADEMHYDVSVRSVNKMGESNWTAPVRVQRSGEYAKFRFVSLNKQENMEIDCDGFRLQFIPNSEYKTFALAKGDVGLWADSHYWEMIMNYSCDVLVGVCELNETLHGTSPENTISKPNSEGAFVMINPSETHLVLGNIWDETIRSGEIQLKPPSRSESHVIGKAQCRIGILLKIRSGCDATVHVYDVTSGKSLMLMEKSFRFSSPLWPIVGATGQASVMLVK